jgi:UDP-glucose 4-epimerase
LSTDHNSLTPSDKRKSQKRALITGGAGFIGSHLSEALLERGYQVTIIDDLSTGRFENIVHLVDHPRFSFAIDTIANEAVLDRLASECTIIYHLAAAVGVKLIVERPVHTIQANVNGTEAVLKAALRYRAKVLIASTSEVYGKGNAVPFREDDDVVLGPTSRSRWAYAASKMVDEFLGLAYHREYGLPVVIPRLFNTVGPRQIGRYGMVIPRFVQQALNGDPLTIYGDGTQSRCFMHVTDAVQGIIALSEHPDALGKVFNLGTTREYTILELAHQVLDFAATSGQAIKSADPKLDFIPYTEAHAEGFDDMQRRVPDISRIQALTPWVPTRTLEDILRDVIADITHDA